MATDAAAALIYLSMPSSQEGALALLTDPLRQWFGRHFGEPTLVQRFAWPAILVRQNLLLVTPTGTGKTLAAMAPIIQQLLFENNERSRCLYLVPLKALGRDVRANLQRHGREMARFLPPNAPLLGVALRTGDTSWRVRQTLWSPPPDILITTPESLAVMLTQEHARAHLQFVRWVVVDEIHAVAATKRGADLSLSLERLSQLVGGAGPQRIGLSATCTPLATAARFLAGTSRPCAIAQVADTTPLELRVESMDNQAASPRAIGHRGSPGASLTARLLDRLAPELGLSADAADKSAKRQQTTLIFTNTRHLAERVTWALRQRYPWLRDRIGVHHSSLAAARRRQLERRLKCGDMRVVVSSTSLELGIDIGAVDLIVLVHPPGGVIRLLQRVGRSAHQPLGRRRGLMLTDGTAELFEAAVTSASGRCQQTEPLAVCPQPLDVLCQHIVGLSTQGWWSVRDALGLVRRAFPYRHLREKDFVDCLAYLSGRHRDGYDWLPPRLRWNGDLFSVVDERTTRLLRRNLGTIVSDEPTKVRLLSPMREQGAALAGASGSTHVALGEVDDSFGDRLRPGDRFVLEGRCLEYRRREKRSLLVTEELGRPQLPRWPGGGWPMSPELARRLFDVRVQAGECLRDGRLTPFLRDDLGLDQPAADELSLLFSLQELLSEIPDHGTLLVERVATAIGAEYAFHTPLARPANDAIARAIAWRLWKRHAIVGIPLAANLGFMLSVRGYTDMALAMWRDILAVGRFEDDVSDLIRESPALRERFGALAKIGLMVLRNPLGWRRRVGGRHWAERRLFEQVEAADPDFVLLRQAREETSREALDVRDAAEYLRALPTRGVRQRSLSNVSPFAAAWLEPAPSELPPSLSPPTALAVLHQRLIAG